MQYRTVPKNGERLSLLAFGCMRFPKDEKLVYDLVGRAIDCGVNYFDTAYIYPGNEAALGKALTPERRGKVNIATKLPPYMVKKTEDFDKLFYKQLERLNTDHIDYYLIHALSSMPEWKRMENLGTADWIEAKKSSGEIRNVGFSFHGGVAEFKDIVDAYAWEFAMIQYNYVDENRQAGKEGLKYAADKGLAVMVMEPLLGGRLATNLPQKAMDIICASDKERSPAEWGLRWVFNQPEVATVLSGMNTLDMLEENLRIAGEARVGELSDDEMDMFTKIRAIFMENQFVPCTGCGYCMPCPQGVDIPLCFSAMNDKNIIGSNRARMNYLLRADRHRASLCVGCGECEEHCPQKIEIRKSLKQTAELMEAFPYKPIRMIVNKAMRRD